MVKTDVLAGSESNLEMPLGTCLIRIVRIGNSDNGLRTVMEPDPQGSGRIPDREKNPATEQTPSHAAGTEYEWQKVTILPYRALARRRCSRSGVPEFRIGVSGVSDWSFRKGGETAPHRLN